MRQKTIVVLPHPQDQFLPTGMRRDSGQGYATKMGRQIVMWRKMLRTVAALLSDNSNGY